MSNYKELVINETANSRAKSIHGIPFFYSEKLRKYLNPINQAQYYTIGGRMSGGKRSFTDLHFVLGAYLAWKAQPESERPPLKILYFNMDKSPKQKLQKYLCTYLWLFHSQLMDTNTLNGMHSRMFAIHAQIQHWIDNSEAFFEEFFQVVDIKHGPTNPMGIYYDVEKYADTIGETVTDGYDKYFKYDEAHEKQITLVIVDNVKKVTNESVGGKQYDEASLHRKLNEHFCYFRDFLKFTPVVIVPAWEVGGVFKLNQMVPDFREFKYYFEDSNVALHLFNPFKFQMTEYNGWKPTDFISESDNIPRFRVCTILRNTEGGDSAQIPLLFTPENGFFWDLPSLQDSDSVTQWSAMAAKFKVNNIKRTEDARSTS